VDADEVILERLEFLRNEVAYLKRERDRIRSFEEYVDDVRLRRAMERSLQISAEACLDIGRRLIALEGFRYPEDNKDVFQVLAEEEVVPQELLPALLDMARFRNLMVHNYAKVDDAKVYGILKRHLGDFDAYARAIADYLMRTAEEAAEEPGDPHDG
jgi:uncharacterized protein YutE (UPF0331/DUF86 family)